MINTNTSVASLLSNIYTSNGASLADSLTKIASGKRVQSPSDDFAGYVRASGLNSDIAGYNIIKQDLQDAKALVDYAKSVGNTMTEDLTRMKELQDAYTKAAGDSTRQASYEAEYDTIVARITAAKANSYYDTTQVYAIATLDSVAINSSDPTKTIAITTSAIGDETAINNIASASAGQIQNEINNAQTFVSEIESFGTQINRALKLSDTVIASKQATVSAIIDVDEAQEMSKVTNLQIRQQATAAMMAQANSSQAAIVWLFQ